MAKNNGHYNRNLTQDMAAEHGENTQQTAGNRFAQATVSYEGARGIHNLSNASSGGASWLQPLGLSDDCSISMELCSHVYLRARALIHLQTK